MSRSTKAKNLIPKTALGEDPGDKKGGAGMAA